MGVVKHILLAKFKEGTNVEELVNSFAQLCDTIDSLKGFHWGKHESTFDQYEEFSHVFECSFESMKGLAEYMVHPLHLAFATEFLPHIQKMAVLDYKPLLLFP